MNATVSDPREPWRDYGRTLPFRHAYVGGTFDCLHRGHLAILHEARRLARYVTVSVNTDAFAERYKRRPVMPYADRVAVLQQCRLVDQVVQNIGDEDSKRAIFQAGLTTHDKAGRPVDLIVHGTDWPRTGLLKQMALTEDWLVREGIVLALRHCPIIHTTEILRAYDDHRDARRGDGYAPACGD